MKRLRVDVWSDIACPWCYVGKRRFETALAQFPERASVQLVWRSFELDPNAPRVQPREVSYAERLAKKYGGGLRQAEMMIERMVDTAKVEGIEMRFDLIRPGNTFDAHRLLHLAHERRVQDAAKERFMRAYFTEGEAIGEHTVLERLAADAGLDRAEVKTVLAGDAFAREAREDETRARELGISGVPFFVFGARYGVSGAQPPEVLVRVLEKSWSEQPELEVSEDGMACGPEGCA